jgi:hypothetical protein
MMCAGDMTNSLNATINQLTASVAADEANIAALTTQLTQVIALYHLLLPPHPVGDDLALTPYPASPAVVQQFDGVQMASKTPGAQVLTASKRSVKAFEICLSGKL